MKTETFWSLVKQSVITQSLLTLLLVITVCVMFLNGNPIPSLLEYLVITVVGFWMGSKLGYAQGQRAAHEEQVVSDGSR